ncbi:hypothetical protein B0H14DRAFT_2406603, partial [Mycena olivaceomarginata]
LDVCSLSVLASSVDAERAFSGGRLQVNHLQHQTSSQTFMARVALGSWIRTPLMPGSSAAAAIMEQALKPKPKGKGKQRAADVIVDDEMVVESDD